MIFETAAREWTSGEFSFSDLSFKPNSLCICFQYVLEAPFNNNTK